MEIMFASGNRHKAEEISALFGPHTVLLPSDRGIAFECEETESTFFGNSLLKAKTLRQFTDLPVLADDSGICVDALGGGPGIYSARYGAENGVNLTAEERNRYLLGKLVDVRDRSCRFVCCMVLLLGKDRFLCAQETLEGQVIDTPLGSGGFGYDPIVYLPAYGKTVAELSPDEKNAMSHRGKAAARILAALSRFRD